MKYQTLRLKYQDVKDYFVSQGCELLENKYKNAKTKMKYRCSCGNISFIIFDSFKKGNRCQKCGNRKNSKKQMLTQEQASVKFLKCGCELLGEYQGASTPTKYRCECGRIATARPNNVWRGRRCYGCSIEKRSGSNHYQWREDRDQVELEYVFRQRCYKLITMVLNVTGRVKNKKSASMLGYDYKQLQEHITNHSNWETVKDEKWHVDHIFPIKAFWDHGITDLKIINSLDNLRPILGKDNCSKNASYDIEEFKEWLKTKGVVLDEA